MGEKEHVAYNDLEDNDLESDVEYNHIEEIEVVVTELKRRPYMCVTYTCKWEKPFWAWEKW